MNSERGDKPQPKRTLICCSETSLGYYSQSGKLQVIRQKTYQIAHDDFTLGIGRESLSRSRLCSRATSSPDGFLDAADRRRCGNTRRSSSLRGTTTTDCAALGLGNLIERLVELARHGDGSR